MQKKSSKQKNSNSSKIILILFIFFIIYIGIINTDKSLNKDNNTIIIERLKEAESYNNNEQNKELNEEFKAEINKEHHTNNYTKALQAQINAKNVVQINKRWIPASSEKINIAMNPSNKSKKEYEYQHLNLSYPSNISISKLSQFLNSKGILRGREETFIEAARNNNLNEIYLAAHAVHETGNGTSVLARGVKVNNVIVYNMFGIHAFDKTAVKSGSEYAYKQGWTTPEKAIWGGAKWISEKYINCKVNKQNTLYKMKWNPTRPGKHQYATDINWALRQAEYISKLYTTYNLEPNFDYTEY